MTLIERAQPLTKTSEVHVGDVVWTLKTEWNSTEQRHDEEERLGRSGDARSWVEESLLIVEFIASRNLAGIYVA